MASRGSVLFVDAYDSFAENIAALLYEQLQIQVTVIKIDCDIQKEFKQHNQEFIASFDAVVLGPGPGNPANDSDVGLFNDVWACARSERIPVLGICLGFQSLCAQYGVPVVRMGLPCHGHPKAICHTDKDIFLGTGSIVATCYNSLGVHLKDFKQDFMSSRRSSSASSGSPASSQSALSSSRTTLVDGYQQSENLDVLAWDEDGWVMAVTHNELPFYGFQFHPESCKSNFACQTLIPKWWDAASIHNKTNRNLLLSRVEPRIERRMHPNVNTSSEDALRLLDLLQSIATPYEKTVSRKSLHLPGAATAIASLCHETSPENRVAMLESTKKGRYSIYAFPHENSFSLEYVGGQVICNISKANHDSIRSFILSRAEAVTTLESFIHGQAFHDVNADVPFRGGFIGFMSYEFGTASLHLDISNPAAPMSTVPEISLLWVDRSIVYDNDTGVAYIQSIRRNDTWIERMITTLHNISEFHTGEFDAERGIDILSSSRYTLPDHDQYITQIRACQSELLAGNSYELCLTTEASVTTPVNPEATYFLYRNIQRHNPVPFASYIRLNKTSILSSSPEHFLSWSIQDGTIDMIPMKGTVKKDSSMTLAKATAILASAKESAENLMIADLIRHDLYSTVGRDANVEVVKLCDVVESETVYSLVSHIRAHAPFPANVPGNSRERAQQMTKYGFRALTQTLPPGSMTGAPKKRSCEILHGLEQRDRGVYSGAIGYIDVCGNGAWSVCIRSAFSYQSDNVKDERTGEEMQKWRIGAGGAITVLSDEEQEWEEMMTKLNSCLKGFRVF